MSVSFYNSTKASCHTNSDQSSYIPYVYTRTPFVPPSGSLFLANIHYSNQAACQAGDATAAGKVSYYAQPNCAAIAVGQTDLQHPPDTESSTIMCAAAPPTIASSAGFMRYQNFASDDCTGTPWYYSDQQLGVCSVNNGVSSTSPRRWIFTDSFMPIASTVGGVTTVTMNSYSDSTCSGTPTTSVMGSSADGCQLGRSGHGSTLLTVIPSTQPKSGYLSTFYYAGYNSQAGCLASNKTSLLYLYPVYAQMCDSDETSSPTGAPIASTFFYKQSLVGCHAAVSISTPPSVSPTSAPTHGSPSTPIAHTIKPVHPPSAKTGVSAASKHSKHAHVRKSSTSGNGKVDVEVDVDVKVDVK